jgi:hypothetical protein
MWSGRSDWTRVGYELWGNIDKYPERGEQLVILPSAHFFPTISMNQGAWLKSVKLKGNYMYVSRLVKTEHQD